jgi:hypothetical protein
MPVSISIISHVSLDNIASGQKKRIFDMVKGLSKSARLKYIFVGQPCEFTGTQVRLGEMGVETELFRNGYDNNIIKILVNVVYGITFPLLGIKKSWFISFIASIINRNRFRELDSDIVIAEYYHNAVAFRHIRHSIKIIDTHDLQFVTLRIFLERSPFKHIFIRSIQIRFAQWLELHYIAKANAIISVNSVESQYIQSKIKNIDVYFCPLTINRVIRKEIDSLESVKCHLNIAYFSNLGTERSRNELKSLVTSILSEVNRQLDNKVILYVLGNNPSEAIKELCKEPNVKLVGFIESIEEGFKDIHFLINYWTEPSYGFRTRVIDALSTGTPVLTNAAGVDGMGLYYGKSIFCFESAHECATLLKHFSEDMGAYRSACEESLVEAEKYLADIVYTKLTMWLENYCMTLPK